jgi:hypothetical protein
LSRSALHSPNFTVFSIRTIGTNDANGPAHQFDCSVANGRFRRDGDSRDAPPDGQFATAETGRALEGQDPAIHWMP